MTVWGGTGIKMFRFAQHDNVGWFFNMTMWGGALCGGDVIKILRHYEVLPCNGGAYVLCVYRVLLTRKRLLCFLSTLHLNLIDDNVFVQSIRGICGTLYRLMDIL